MKLLVLLKKHFSLLLIIVGAGAVFFSNIILKGVLTEFEYGEYSIFITFLQLCISFGLLGLEQVFMRVAEVSKNASIHIDKKLIIGTLVVGILASALLSFFFVTYFFTLEINYWLLFLLTFASAMTMFYYNVLRIRKDFSVSQLVNNSWKFLLFIIAIFLFFQQEKGATYFITLFSYIFIAIWIIFSVYIIKNIVFDYRIHLKMKTILSYSFHFTLSMITLTFIAFFDRFFIKGAFGSEVFGNYFYLSTIFYFPFSLIQGYIGFKELVYFKTHASTAIVKKKLVSVNVFSVLLAVGVVLVSWLLNYYNIIPAISFESDWVLILFLLLLGITRINYSLLSSVMGAIGSVKLIRNANFQSLFFILLILLVGYRYITSIEIVAFSILLIWMSRIIIWYYNSLKQLKLKNA